MSDDKNSRTLGFLAYCVILNRFNSFQLIMFCQNSDFEITMDHRKEKYL